MWIHDELHDDSQTALFYLKCTTVKQHSQNGICHSLGGLTGISLVRKRSLFWSGKCFLNEHMLCDKIMPCKTIRNANQCRHLCDLAVLFMWIFSWFLWILTNHYQKPFWGLVIVPPWLYEVLLGTMRFCDGLMRIYKVLWSFCNVLLGIIRYCTG